jgi:hypothetical protein
VASPPRPETARIEAATQRLRELAGDSEAYTGALIDNVWWYATANDELGGTHLHDISADEAAEAAAFRQEELIRHSLKAVRRALQNVEKDLGTVPVDALQEQWDAHVGRYIVELQRREDLFKAVAAGVAARDDGILIASPNPRRRAEHMIAQRNLAEDIPRGEITRLTAQLRRRKR